MNPGDLPADRPNLYRYLVSFLRSQLLYTLVPGAICSSPLLLMWLSESIPVLGVLALVAILPALVTALYFLPAIQLIKIYEDYEPRTLKGGSLLPLPAYSAGDWVKLLTAQAKIVAMIWVLWQLGVVMLRRKKG